jgi:predicted permease
VINRSGDLRYAVRAFVRTPAFTIAALLSIALGVGANTAIYSVLNALLLRPLPYADADRLVILWNRSPGLGIAEDWFSTAQYFDIKNGHGGFDDLAIAIGGSFNLTGNGEPERVGTIRMSSNLLPMLGARAILGRLLSAADDRPGTGGVAILGYGTWIRRYGRDPRVLGRTMRLNGQPYQIVGVLAASFALPREVMPTLDGAEDAEVVLPLPLGPDAATRRDREDYNIVGKLKRGLDVAAAQAEMDAITARLRREHPVEYPANGGLTFGIVPLHEQVVGNVRRSVLMLMAAVGFVLLIACANVANLQLARALARSKEIAVRAALGASRGRLAVQVLTESLVLGLVGGALGIAVGYAGVEFIRALGAQSVPRLREISIDAQVLAFTLALSIAAAALFGVVPAWRVGRVDVNGLTDNGRGATGGSLWGRQRGRRALVAAELALALVLLAGAGLLTRSFAAVKNIPAGFDARDVLTFEITLNGSRYASSTIIVDTARELSRRLDRVPGVRAAGAVSALPLSQMFAWGPIAVEGRTPTPGDGFINADLRMVSGRYFEAMQIPLKEGRLFSEHDTASGQRVTIVDEFMAQQLWSGRSAIGRRVGLIGGGTAGPWLTVVGIVGRVKQYALDADSRIAMYLPHAQFPARSMNVVVRSDAERFASLPAAVRREVTAVDPDLPIFRLRSMVDRVDDSLARRRFAMLLLAVFAAVAVGLAVVGVYGVMGYLVSQGSRELGIRLALGATPAGVRWLVIRQGVWLTLAGIGAGLVGAAALMRLLRSLLFNVSPSDPLTYLSITAVLAAVALLATCGPARRAGRIDPLSSLRVD